MAKYGSSLEARIIPVRQEQLKERLVDRFRELDTPLLVEWPDGRRKAILFVDEEESITSGFSIYRLTRYCMDLAERMKTDHFCGCCNFCKLQKVESFKNEAGFEIIAEALGDFQQ